MRRAFALLALVAACKSGGNEGTTAKTAEDAHTLSGATEAWCPEGFEGGANDSCFALPEKSVKDTPILAYLHGMYQGHGSPEEWSAVRAAVQKGYAVVLLRGKRGLCPWKAEFKDYYCWPQDPEDTDAMKGVIADWDKALWQVDALMEQGGAHKRYFLAFSNGGFFASYVATHNMFSTAQAWAIIDGGSIAPTPAAPATPAPAKGKAPPAGGTSPILLVEAKDDAEQAPKTKELHEALTKASWPHAYCPQPGGKSLTAADVDQALSFFKRDQAGALKPQGTSYSCEEQAAPPPKKK